MARNRTIQLRVNSVDHEGTVEVRKTLSDFLREDLGLCGTNIGCEHGVCGACTILMNGCEFAGGRYVERPRIKSGID